MFFLFQPPDCLSTQRAAGERKLSGCCAGTEKNTEAHICGFFFNASETESHHVKLDNLRHLLVPCHKRG